MKHEREEGKEKKKEVGKEDAAPGQMLREIEDEDDKEVENEKERGKERSGRESKERGRMVRSTEGN